MKSPAWVVLFCSTVLISSGADKRPTVADAKAFLDEAEAKLLVLSVESGRADWGKDNFITDDTELHASKADERASAATGDLVKQSSRLDSLTLPAVLTR